MWRQTVLQRQRPNFKVVGFNHLRRNYLLILNLGTHRFMYRDHSFVYHPLMLTWMKSCPSAIRQQRTISQKGWNNKESLCWYFILKKIQFKSPSAQLLLRLPLLAGHLLVTAVLQLFALVIVRSHFEQPAAVDLNHLQSRQKRRLIPRLSSGCYVLLKSVIAFKQFDRRISSFNYEPHPPPKRGMVYYMLGWLYWPVSWTPLWWRPVRGRWPSGAAPRTESYWGGRTPSAGASQSYSHLWTVVQCDKNIPP